MVEKGTIYWCHLCEKFLRYEKVCPDCLSEGKPTGWMVTHE